MEDFFKNKLDDFDASGDDWDRPDRKVWESAREQFPKYPKKEKLDWKTLALALMGIATLLMGAGLISVQQSGKELEGNLKKNSMELHSTKQELGLLQKKCKEERLGLIAENEEAKLINAQLLEAQKQDAYILIEKEKTIQFLQQKNQEITKTIEELKTIISRQKDFPKKEYADKQASESETRIIQETSNKDSKTLENNQEVNKMLRYQSVALNPLMLAKFPLNQHIGNPIDQEFIFPTIPVKRKRKKIELGIVLTTMLENPMWSKFDKLESLTKETPRANVDHSAIGFHMAYGLRPNFFIKTGIRYAKTSSEVWMSSGLTYDESGEYINDDGKKAQDITLTTYSTYGEVKDQVSVLLPEDEPLETGDIVVSKLSKLMNFQFMRIPLGVEYYFGKQRLQWQLQGGMAWNKLFLEYVPVEGAVYYKDKEIPIKKVTNLSTTLDKEYLSSYLGTGVNYRFKDRWNLRTALVFEYDFIEAETATKPIIYDPKGLDWVVDIGLYYRF